jgi:hypothetical protein
MASIDSSLTVLEETITATLTVAGETITASINTAARGAKGQGVPDGGTTGQVLAKASGEDYDTEWIDQTSGPGGSSTFEDLEDAETADLPEINTPLATALAGKSPTSHNHAGVYDPAGSAAAVGASLSSHTSNTSNPHGVTKSQVGLGDVDNTSDAAKKTAENARLLAATIISKTGAKTEYIASANTDAARGVALTTAIKAIAAGQTLVCSPGDYYMAETNLLLVDNCTYLWNGAKLYIDGSSSSSRSGRESGLDICLFTSGSATAPLNVSNWKFMGPATLDGGNVSNRRGMMPIGTSGALVQSIRFTNWGNTGFGFLSAASTGKNNRMTDCTFDTCAGTGAEFNSEYWALSNCHADLCAIGLTESGGNGMIVNCSVTFCTTGFRVMNNSNPGHGTWIGGNFNHCTTGVFISGSITADAGGWNFIGAVAHSTALDISGKGCTWTGGEIANTSFASSGTNAGVSQFIGVRGLSTSTAEATSLAGLSSAKRANFKFRNCRDELGALVSWNDYVDAAYVAKTANYTLTGADHTVNVTANSPTITLPTAGNAAGRTYVITNSGAGTVTLATTSSQTIDGAAPGTLVASAKITVQSNGSNWITLVPASLTFGTGVQTALGVNVGSAGAPVLFNGALGTPSSGNVTACTQRVTIPLAPSDETTALTTGTGKITFRMPHAMTVTGVRASLTTAQASGSIFTVDINEAGTSILSTKLTIDNTEKTSTTAATAAVVSDTALADDAEITVDIDQIGDGTAKGLKVYLIGTM